ncbi:S-layer homology domain-containing protein [bacterium]|nr:S-layer homology domain-containing protein [bacterium]
MTIKKLTVAAAIAVGIATCSFSGAMAACPCNSSNSNITNGCKEIVTPETSTCPRCHKDKAKCHCQDMGDLNGAAAAIPKASTDLNMKQVYAYPNAVYGTNNYVGEESNSIYSTKEPWRLDNACGALSENLSGVTIGENSQITGAAAPACGCDKEQLPVITGGAAPAGLENTGVSVQRDSSKMDGADESVSIETQSSMKAIKKTFEPFEASSATGGAAPLVSSFTDVPGGYWAGCDIDRLATTNVIAGYPDRTFKPALPVSRAEFASMMVKGFNLNIAGCDCLQHKNIFKDVAKGHWANPVIAKAVEDGIMEGYPNNTFKPAHPVSRAEALAAMAHGINCEMDTCKAKEILGQYCDGDKVPSWAEIPVAKALETGVLNNSPDPKTINPCRDASRADVASMLQTVRIAGGYDKLPTTACNTCQQKTAYMENENIVDIPTLKLSFLDQVNAKSSHVGQQFAAKTLEDVTINGKLYPSGSRVNGKIVEVIRPSGCHKGALKLAFTNIEDCNGCKATLPKQIMTAQVDCGRKPNAVARLIASPFTLAGTIVGTAGRTIGGMVSNASNAIEDISNGTGIAFGETFQGQFRAAGRSLQDATKSALIMPVDASRTALSGTIGLFQTSADEVAYLVDPKGNRVAQVNPKEHITIAFGDACSK